MKPVFVDTSALIAIGNRKDAFHRQAVEVRKELRLSRKNFVTTNAVLFEFGNAFSKVRLKPAAVRIMDAIRTSKKWKCVNADETLTERGFQRFSQMKDKEWGFVDCISMIVAEDFGIAEIFTTDHHFEQAAGFTILLKKG